MLSFFGWIDGLTATGVVAFGIIFGLFFIYRSRKSKAKLLTYLGITNILAGLVFMGVFLDFITVLLTGTNIDNTYGLVGILSYVFYAPIIIVAIHIGEELLIPKKKWYALLLAVVLSVIFEIFIFLDPLGSFNFVEPVNPGVELIDYNVNLGTPAGILMACLLLYVILFLGLGFLYRSIKSSGVLRKKFFLLFLGVFCFCLFGLLEGLTAPGITVIFVRAGYLSSFWFMYYGL